MLSKISAGLSNMLPQNCYALKDVMRSSAVESWYGRRCEAAVTLVVCFWRLVTGSSLSPGGVSVLG
jgi:hypothetical protein